MDQGPWFQQQLGGTNFATCALFLLFLMRIKRRTMAFFVGEGSGGGAGQKGGQKGSGAVQALRFPLPYSPTPPPRTEAFPRPPATRPPHRAPFKKRHCSSFTRYKNNTQVAKFAPSLGPVDQVPWFQGRVGGISKASVPARSERGQGVRGGPRASVREGRV